MLWNFFQYIIEFNIYFIQYIMYFFNIYHIESIVNFEKKNFKFVIKLAK